MDDIEKIKERIAKLLRMAADSASPNEAAIAAQRARALMDKHQLDEWDIDQKIKEEFATEDATRAYAALPAYIDIFSVCVAKYNDCQSVAEYARVDHKKKKDDILKKGRKIVFRGYKSDVQMAIVMFKSLNDAVNRFCKEWMQAQGLTAYSVRIGALLRHSLQALAAFRELGQRLEAMTKERDAITMSNGNALVVIKAKHVEAEFGDPGYSNVKLRAPDEEDELEIEAHNAGREKGRTIEIIKSLDEDSVEESGGSALRLN